MAAYSRMLGEPTCSGSCWSYDEASIGTHTVEHRALGNVNLYFLNLHDGGADRYAGLGA
ncbi:hypothetical protein ABIA38_009062 [Embleya sp. AB8]